MSAGMDMQRGGSVSDMGHLQQSISKILTTPVGTRIKRREFGSMLPELLDHPLNEETALLLYAATATALYQHEPRFRLSRARLDVSTNQKGVAALELSGIAIFRGRAAQTTFTVPVLGTRSQA